MGSVGAEFGSLVGRMLKGNELFKQDFIPSDGDEDITFASLENVSVTGVFYVYTQQIGTAFMVNHPVNGVVNSANTVGTSGLGSRSLVESGLL